MVNTWLGEPVDTGQLAAGVRDLGVVVMRFGTVERKTRHPDGKRRETDTTHTVMLGLIACALAERINDALPAGSPDQLSVGLVAQHVLVHDLPEVYADDTATLRLLSVAELAAKSVREAAAAKRLEEQFVEVLPWVPLKIRSYERQMSAEARFVRAVDKIMPKITHVENGAIVPYEDGMSVDELAERYRVQREQMVDWAGRWPVVIDLYDHLVDAELEALRYGQ
jgi:putative hydrolase of HD superfamily